MVTDPSWLEEPVGNFTSVTEALNSGIPTSGVINQEGDWNNKEKNCIS